MSRGNVILIIHGCNVVSNSVLISALYSITDINRPPLLSLLCAIAVRKTYGIIFYCSANINVKSIRVCAWCYV